MTVYGKFGHNAACVNVGKSIEFFFLILNKPTRVNGQVYYIGNGRSYDNKTWRTQYLDTNNSYKCTKKKIFLMVTFKQTIGQYFVIYNYTFIQGGGYLSENSLPGKNIFNCTALMHEQYNEEYYSSDWLYLHSLSQQICLQYQII